MNGWAANALIPSKTIHYLPNGTGRDSYIFSTSGGLMAAESIKSGFSLGIFYI